LTKLRSVPVRWFGSFFVHVRTRYVGTKYVGTLNLFTTATGKLLVTERGSNFKNREVGIS